MTHPHKLFAAAILTFALAAAAPADGIIYGGFMPTPTPTPAAPTEPTGGCGGGEMPPPDPSGEELRATDIAIESALRVLGQMFLLY
jgi:hypothetical protein